VSLAGSLERAATALPADADAIRPANGDPQRLLASLGTERGARVLAWLLAHEPEAGSELAAAWCVEETGTEAVLAVDEASLPKPGRKVLRRVLHALRSRGHALPEAPPAPRVATLPPIEEGLEGAYVSPLDPTGGRVVYFVEPNPAGGGRIFEVVLSERLGVAGFDAYSPSRKQVRRFVQEITTRERFAAVPAPIDAVRALVARAAAAHPADRSLPRGFLEWRSRVATASGDARTPGALALEALAVAAPGEEPPADLLAAAARLVRERKLLPFLPPREALVAEAERLRDATRSRVIVSGPARAERTAQLFAEAAERLFAGDTGLQAAHAFAEAAFLAWKGGRDEEARACAAASLRFRLGRPGDHPVALALVEGVLGAALEQMGEEERESLLVRP
jgi:hypothetical protein